MKTLIQRLFITAMVFIIFAVGSQGQTTVTIGTGTLSSFFPYTTVWMDARTDFLITAAELSGGGAMAAPITRIGFDVTSSSSQTMNGFNIKMQHTALTSLTGFTSTGWTTVYSTPYSVPGTGWQMITLTTPFVWNGANNLLIEICFDNTSYSANSSVNGTAATGKIWGNFGDNTAGCSLAAGYDPANRPNTRLIFCPTPAQPSTITGATTPCVSTSQNYSVTNVPGTTYTWTFPTGWTQTGGGTTNAITVTVGSGTGNITVTPSTTCGNGTPRTLAVTPTNVPAQPSTITGNITPYFGTSENYSVTNVAGVIYTWTFPTGWVQTGGGNTNSVTVTVGSGSGLITCTPSNSCGNGTPRTLAVTVQGVGIKEISGSKSLNISPNPTDGIVSINFIGYTGEIKFSVKNSIGGLLSTEQIIAVSDNFIKQIDLSKYPNGIYYLTIDNKSKTAVQKIVKK